jgi:hypothetical protein
MNRLINAIENENFSRVKTLAYQNPELLHQVFNKKGQATTVLKLAKNIAGNTQKNTPRKRIQTYLEGQGGTMPPPPTVMNLERAINARNLNRVKKILNGRPELINEEYTNVSGEPYTVLKRANRIASSYPYAQSIEQQIVRELRKRGGVVPVWAPSHRREGLPPRIPNPHLRPHRNITRGIAMRRGRRTRRRR